MNVSGATSPRRWTLTGRIDAGMDLVDATTANQPRGAGQQTGGLESGSTRRVLDTARLLAHAGEAQSLPSWTLAHRHS